MNEKIKQFLKEAEKKCIESNDLESNFSIEMIPEVFFNKFSILIIEECAKIVRNADLEDVEGGDSAVLRAASEQIQSKLL